VAQPECILLRFGESRGLALARRVTFWSAFGAVVLAPAHPLWRLSLALLLLVLGRHTSKKDAKGRLRLWGDGAVKVFEQRAPADYRRDTGGWVSRWFSVVPLVDPVRHQRRHVIICAANNPAREYRRLLGWMRWRPPGGSA